jgi:hypothetical protein
MCERAGGTGALTGRCGQTDEGGVSGRGGVRVQQRHGFIVRYVLRRRQGRRDLGLVKASVALTWSLRKAAARALARCKSRAAESCMWWTAAWSRFCACKSKLESVPRSQESKSPFAPDAERARRSVWRSTVLNSTDPCLESSDDAAKRR